MISVRVSCFPHHRSPRNDIASCFYSFSSVRWYPVGSPIGHSILSCFSIIWTLDWMINSQYGHYLVPFCSRHEKNAAGHFSHTLILPSSRKDFPSTIFSLRTTASIHVHILDYIMNTPQASSNSHEEATSKLATEGFRKNEAYTVLLDTHLRWVIWGYMCFRRPLEVLKEYTKWMWA